MADKRKPRRRRVRWLGAAVVLGLLVWAGWAYLSPSPVHAIEAGSVSAVEVRFERWGEDGVAAPGARSADPDAVASLVAVLRSAEETSEHKCASRGVVVLHRSRGLPAELHFLPGHNEEWYEFRYAHRIYRMPRAAFVAAMQRVGVMVPLEPQ